MSFANAAPTHRPGEQAHGGTFSEYFRYHGLWAPGLRLFRAIGFRSKAVLISLLFALPIVVLAVSYFGDKAAALDFSRAERTGVAYLRAALPVVQVLQAQRLAALEASATGQPTPAFTAADTALAALAKAQAAHGASLQTDAAHAALLAKIAALPAAAGGVEARLAAHDEAVAAALALVNTATDQSNLTLDPDLDTYYLMDAATGALPGLAEATSRQLAVVLALAQGAEGTPALQKLLGGQEAVGELMDARWAAGTDKVASLHPGVKAAMDFDAARAAVHRFHELAAGGADVAGLRGSGTDTLAALLKAQGVALDELDRLLAARVARLEQSRAWVVGLLLACAGLVTYLFVAFQKVLEGGLREVAFHINAMRDGDLTTAPRAWGADEAALLMHALTDMQASLRRIVSQVRVASDEIVTASSQIASGAQDLSQRTEHSAANLQQTAAAMEQIAATARQSEASVGEATRIARDNAAQAERGGQIVGRVVATMQDINQSSGRIGEIIGTIDSIAFQTNILALNAAVEAARAGEQGRGFAVVASEVRALAQRSAAAAREIKSLIGASVEKAEAGARVVREAGSTIDDIVGSARRVDSLLSEVATGAREQSRGVVDSTQAVQKLDGMTQQNAALVEQTAAAAGMLKGQAEELAVAVSRFRLPAHA